MTRILIVEDETRLASFIEKGLKRQGFETHTAEDGQKALQCLGQLDFDVVLLDLSLPIFDGWVVLEKIRQRGATVPVIIVTALLDEHDRSRVLAAGADDYLRKPFRFNDLMAIVQKHTQ
jgi:two-component system, OmpR family, copper resistance phosphate regulon response regulator CusR